MIDDGIHDGDLVVVQDGKVLACDAGDLPAAWNAGMRDLLGIEPPDDALGCLQDVHWSIGLFGYFPTYALGSMMAAQQLAQQAQAQVAAAAQKLAGAPAQKKAADEVLTSVNNQLAVANQAHQAAEQAAQAAEAAAAAARHADTPGEAP